VHDVLRVGVTYYDNRIRDLITTDVTGTTWANVGRATTDGIESFIAYQPLKELTLRVDYTYTQAEDDVLEQPLLRRPKHRGSFVATWQATRAWQWNLDVLAVGNWVDVSRDGLTSDLNAPGYTTVNLATSYDLTPRVALFARVDNLLDRHYENPIGFLQPSIGVYAGLKVRL
jgi:vitamin B12 transporter